MALSRSEIELLIKARNEAQGAFDQLNRQVTAVTGETNKATTGMENLGKETKNTGVAATATGVAVGVLAERLARGLVNGFNETIQAANRLDAGLIGLQSVAKAFGNDADAAKEAAKTLAKDGLLSVGEAATGLKNLLATGFNLPQAIDLMNAFKDSSAFGRQSALSFGQAVVSATEGVKNGNSILVDNAGITKNLSQILVEAGFSAQDLSKAGGDLNVRMALFNGILKEGQPQRGDTLKFLDTAAGKQAQFSAQVEIAQQKIGKALQPALASALDVLQPFVQVLGDMAPVLVPLAGALAAVVVPMAAMRAAAALGIPSLAGLTGEAVKMFGVFSGVRTLTDARAGIQLVGEAAGLTTAKLGPLGTAAAVAGAAFAGWQIGKAIDQLTGASTAIENFTVRLFNLGSASLAAQQKTEVLERASRAVGRAITDYGEAIKITQNLETIRQGQFNKSIELQQRVIAAELELGRITQQTANERLAALAGEERAQQVQRNRIGLAESIRQAEQQIRNEIAATGLSMGQLLQALRTNEDGFKRWAEQNKLSADTVKFLEDRLKAQTDAQKKATEETKKAAEEQKRLQQALEAVGIVTAESVNEELRELAAMQKAATDAGVPLFNVVRALNPQLMELAKQAEASGIKVDGLGRAMNEQAAVLAANIPKLDASIISTTFDITKFGGKTVEMMSLAQVNTMLAEKAMKNLGITSQKELQGVADSARQSWVDIVRVYGEKSPEATAAYKAMIEAQKKASGELPGFWQTQVFPGISQVVGNIQTAVEGSFAQMLLGAKGFSEGFTDIWKSLKAGVLNILNEILSAFINSFLKGLLGAMAGQQGAFSQAFGGLFGGGGGGGIPGLGGGGGGGGLLGKIPGIGKFFGGGAQAGAAGGAPGAAAGGGGGLGSFFTGTLGGSLLGAGAGGLGGFFLGNKFGTGAGIGGGVASGALTGLAFGGPIGAGVGALAGLIGGIIGGGQNSTKKQREQFAGQLGYGNLGALYSDLQSKGDEGAELARIGSAVIGKKDTEGNRQWMEDVLAFLQKAEEKQNALTAATDKYGLTWEDMDQKVRQTKITELADQLKADTDSLTEAGYRYDAVIVKQADSYSALAMKSKELQTELPAALQPVLQQLLDMGLLVDENGEKLTDLSGIMFEQAKQQAEAQKTTTDLLADYQTRLTELVQQQADAQTDIEREKLANQIQDLQTFLDEAQRRLGQGIEIPIRYTQEGDIPSGDVPQPEGQAAGGVMASRPGLVIFGEGGETEVGGPASFFQRIFEQLGIGKDSGGGLGGGGVVVNFGPGSIQVLDASGLEAAVEKRIIPAITDAVNGNKRASRTNLRAALGVS